MCLSVYPPQSLDFVRPYQSTRLIFSMSAMILCLLIYIPFFSLFSDASYWAAAEVVRIRLPVSQTHRMQPCKPDIPVKAPLITITQSPFHQMLRGATACLIFMHSSKCNTVLVLEEKREEEYSECWPHSSYGGANHVQILSLSSTRTLLSYSLYWALIEFNSAENCRLHGVSTRIRKDT